MEILKLATIHDPVNFHQYYGIETLEYIAKPLVRKGCRYHRNHLVTQTNRRCQGSRATAHGGDAGYEYDFDLFSDSADCFIEVIAGRIYSRISQRRETDVLTLVKVIKRLFRSMPPGSEDFRCGLVPGADFFHGKVQFHYCFSCYCDCFADNTKGRR